MERYRHADLMIDQLLLGWYGGLAVECMALGVPVISYVRPSDLRQIPAGMQADLPVIGADRHTLDAVLKEWLTVRRRELPDVGVRSRKFVETWHNPVEIARLLAQDYWWLRHSKRYRRAA
jgi:predicted glycosyltransferase